MPRWNLVWLLVVPAAVALGLAVTASAPPPDRDYQLVRSIVDVLAEVDRHYVRDLSAEDRQRLVEDMINGGLRRLDPHSEYFNEEDLADFETLSEGHFGGIGVQLDRDPTVPYLKVASPMPGTPAYEAGVQADDLILKVGDRSTENMSIPEARKLITGPPGTQVTLTILHDGASKPRDVTLTRAVIELHPVLGVARDPADPTRWDFMVDKENRIAMIRLIGFNEKSDKELRAAVEQAERDGARALVLDLRDNGGGLLGQAVAISDLFLTGGVIVATKDRRGDGRSWSAKADGTVFTPADRRPMAVLVNGGTASASEIVAAALQDHGRAVVVGERTYGKGSVQKVFPMPDGRGAVKLTTETWQTPAGRTIHRWPDATEADDWGVRPDPGLEVKLTLEQRLEQVKYWRAVDTVRGKPGMVKDAPNGPAPAAPAKEYRDPVLEKALEHLRGKLKDHGAAPAPAPWRNAA
jgi:carboxyl-terminal processing protease